MEKNQAEDSKITLLKSTILAAGAILWRKKPFSSDIAVVHRTRYGGEWCLPKGKVEDGKTLKETALREVQEETGCVAKVLRFAAVIEYKVKGTKKQVFYWHMSVVDESKWAERDPEVDQIVWLAPEEAIKLLDHAEQRQLIKDQLIPKAKIKNRKWTWISKTARYHRLAGSVLAYRTELEHRKCSIDGSEKVDQCWIISAIKLLSDAERYMNNGDIDEAWKCFHAAQRIEIFSMNYEQVLVKATLIRNEAVKLGAWRQKTISELLDIKTLIPSPAPDPIKKPPSDVVEKVVQAAILRDESYNNQAHKDELVKEHIRFLTMVAFIVGFLLLLFWLLSRVVNPRISQNTLILLHCPLFGMLGAIFSAALKVQATSQSSRIPELLNARIIATLRLFIGGISAFIIYIFINSQFVSSLVSLDPKLTATYIYSFYFIAFVAGFSERLVLKAIDVVIKDKEQSK
jgi:8-oxo-dGTP pyrophosphatase MutT (NUDIX family)